MIQIKSLEDIKIMRQAGRIWSTVFEELALNIKVGVSAAQLDRIAYDTIVKFGAEPSFLGYKGYKYTTCVSKNEEVVHGIPHENKILYPGDICSIDLGVFYQGFHVDGARTFPLDGVLPRVQEMIDVAERAFFEGICHASPGNRLGKISSAIQKCVEDAGFSVVRDLYSHGIGRELHEEPLIPNFGKKHLGPVLKEGMTFAIEPMINMGVYDILTLPDKWTIITADKKWSAHYENTIYIGPEGAEILTKK